MRAFERLALLAESVPNTCSVNLWHAADSGYCTDHGGEVPELLTESLSNVRSVECDSATADRVCAYLYERSPELRMAVAAFEQAEPGDRDFADVDLALLTALELAEAEVSS